MKSKFLLLLCTVIILFGTAVGAQADLISGPFSTTTPIPYTSTDWTGSLLFPKFDSSLGSLTQIELALSSNIRTVLTVNNAGLSSSGYARTEVMISVGSGFGSMTGQQIDQLAPKFTFLNLGDGQQVTSGTLTTTGSSDNFYTDAYLLNLFTGSGSISIPVDTLTTTVLSWTGGSATASQVTNASATGTVTYYYNAVPIPAAVWLLGSGLVGLIGIRRRFVK